MQPIIEPNIIVVKQRRSTSTRRPRHIIKQSFFNPPPPKMPMQQPGLSTHVSFGNPAFEKRSSSSQKNQKLTTQLLDTYGNCSQFKLCQEQEIRFDKSERRDYDNMFSSPGGWRNNGLMQGSAIMAATPFEDILKKPERSPMHISSFWPEQSGPHKTLNLYAASPAPPANLGSMASRINMSGESIKYKSSSKF